jgi:hypothetical protein
VLNWASEEVILAKKDRPRVICAGCERAMREKQRQRNAETGAAAAGGGNGSGEPVPVSANKPRARSSSPPPAGASGVVKEPAAAPPAGKKAAAGKGGGAAAAAGSAAPAGGGGGGAPAATCSPQGATAPAGTASKKSKRPPTAAVPPSSEDGSGGGGGGARAVHVLPGGVSFEMEAPAGGRPKRAVRACADCGGKNTSAWWGVESDDEGAWLSYTINSAPQNKSLWCDSCVTAKRKAPATARSAVAASPASDRTERR